MKKVLCLMFAAMLLCGLADAMTERGWYNGSTWVKQHVNIANYKAMARDYRATGPTWAAFAAREDGSGLVKVVTDNWGSSWHEMAVQLDRNYKALAGMKVSADSETYSGVFAIRADSNAVEWVRYNGSNWVVSEINDPDTNSPMDCKAIAFDSASNIGSGSYAFYVSRSDGTGVDQIASSDHGVTWVKNSAGQPTTANYKALCSINGAQGFVGAKVGGGLERVYWTGSQWATTIINNVDYAAIAEQAYNAGPAFVLFGSKADGSGVDQIVSQNWAGTWTTYSSIVPEYYKALAGISLTTDLNMFIGSYNCDKSIFDVNNDCIVDLKDFAEFAADWLDCAKEAPGSCN